MVYVLSTTGKPLMPCKEAKARKLLKKRQAVVKYYSPFTIKLLFVCENIVQRVVLGVDPGSKAIGLSASTSLTELYSAEVYLRTDIVKLLADRRQYRRSRRARLRHRKCRILNRIGNKQKGWLPPSIRHKIGVHFNVIENVHRILPISSIIVETGSFDIQKIKDIKIKGKEYQKGNQLGFYNVREYVISRDGHFCRNCKGKSKDKILHMHHITSRKTGGDSPDNLVTLCKTCHEDFHKGMLDIEFTKGKSFKDATFMNIMKVFFYDELCRQYSKVTNTYGYITKQNRVKYSLPKSHSNDAFCIAGNLCAKKLDCFYYFKSVRKNNRKIHKSSILKGGTKRINQAPYKVKGFRLYDKVFYRNIVCFIFGRRVSGAFNIRKLDGTVIRKSASCNRLKLIEKRKSLLMDTIYKE